MGQNVGLRGAVFCCLSYEWQKSVRQSGGIAVPIFWLTTRFLLQWQNLRRGLFGEFRPYSPLFPLMPLIPLFPLMPLIPPLMPLIPPNAPYCPYSPLFPLIPPNAPYCPAHFWFGELGYSNKKWALLPLIAPQTGSLFPRPVS